ncbi:isocitrate lyase/phosphoenolpyruvate mutase family protein [Streptomyces sp. DH37]|uniref:isocitrate lyase/PEP mutase family protein n=1 Tax=Streptomyces sp. DH37 TaxID=3040122 RepID=UPI0024412691|nr:isocitrate lyase/phosphoenolpyruvate mutase family protein [Streptomyces sp. DH37]MDG9705442.1 isocitrate lyase/phosphoenolpyruvate mutase family protein [Streptomyces sp. DH37]
MNASAAFRALHRPGRPLLLPCAWDHASAAALAAHGFPAVGTTSLGVAAAAGLPDATGAARGQTLALGRRLARLPVPVSVDIEGGFADDPAEVALLARELADAGVAGVNLEDGLPDGRLADPVRHAEKIAAVREAAPALFVNARTDTHWLAADPTTAAAARRAHAYREAGADGVFVPALTGEDGIRALAGELDAPLNVLFSPGHHTYERLAELGVARISLGSLLFRAALGRAVELAASVADPAAEAAAPPSYDEALALSRPWADGN